MDERKPAHTRNRASRDAPPHATGGKHEQWVLDPVDVRRHARILRERQRVGPLGKLVRYASVALVLVGAVTVYWNFDTLRGITVDFPGLQGLLAGGAPDGSGRKKLFGGEPDQAVVEATEVAGAAAQTSLSTDRPRRRRRAPPRPRRRQRSAARKPRARRATLPRRPRRRRPSRSYRRRRPRSPSRPPAPSNSRSASTGSTCPRPTRAPIS